MCMMFLSPWYDGFSSGFICEVGEKKIKATAMKEFLLWDASKRVKKKKYNEKHPEMQPLPNVSFDCDGFQLELKDMNSL